MKQTYKKYLNRGVATLPTVILFGILILAVGLSILSLGLSEGFMSLNSSQSSTALFYADAGAKDALLRIARNKNYTCTATDCYSLDMTTNGCSTGNGCAKVSVSAGTGVSGNPKIITSKGQVKSDIRILQASVLLDASLNGQISSVLWGELTN